LAAGELVQLAKRLAVGRPFPTARMSATLLPKRLALPVFASDALSSVAYATEATLVVLLAASVSARGTLLPISAAIAALLAIVVSSYRQTVREYSSSGGAYIVARENLGLIPAVVAAAALLIDYSLTVAVSIAAGVLALVSAVPGLAGLRLELALGFLALLALANLRGVRESGLLFALPTYGFVAVTGAMVVAGLAQCASGGCAHAVVPNPAPVGPALGTVGALVVLRAFASGCAALTGVEAIANGVNAFRPPQARNAAQTLLIMGAIAIALFLGVSALAYETGARPSGTVSVVSEIARAVFPAGGVAAPLFYLVQFFTFAILVLAANTAFQGFPRLTALLARDGLVPRHFANLGDRLVYSNGVIVLAFTGGGLLLAFRASVNGLIHLYLIGVFTAFTLSQAGMVRHWARRRREGGAGLHGIRARMAVNAVGALATGLVTVLVVATKFTQGAWIVLLVLPPLVVAFLQLRARHERLERQLAAPGRRRPAALGPVVVCVERLDAATAEALAYARAVCGGRFRAVHAATGVDAGRELRARWSAFAGPGVELELLDAGGDPAAALAAHLLGLRPGEPDLLTAVVPETFAKRSLLTAARRSTAFALHARLFGEPGIAVTDVRALVAPAPAAAPRPVSGAHALVLVAAADQAAARAVAYALSLGCASTRAVLVALDAEQAAAARRGWAALETPLELEVVEAPLRELDTPVLDLVRGVTRDPGALAVVVMPELATPRWWQDLLYNERSLHLRWILLFEPRVVVCAVPYAVTP